MRGICCLRPGFPGVSERIRVVSIVGRFLEHSRLWYFANGGEEEFYIGSADWMPRNFDRRVEAVAPVEDPALHARLRSLLDTYLDDNRQAWELAADGMWTQREPDGAGARVARAAAAQLVGHRPRCHRADEARPRPGARRRLSRGGDRYSISSVSTSSEESTRPSGATISTGTPATFASSSDFRLRAPHLEPHVRARVSRDRRNADRALRPANLEVADRAHVSAIEAIGHAQERRQALDAPAQRPCRARRSCGALLRRRAAMIARHVGDHDLIRRRDAEQIRVKNEMVRVLVVPLVADVIAGVVQQRGVGQAHPDPRASQPSRSPSASNSVSASAARAPSAAARRDSARRTP